MYGPFAKQMQDFTSSLQQVMTEHMQQTMKHQLEMLKALQAPAMTGAEQMTTGMQKIMLERTRTFNTAMQPPMDNQVKEFTKRIQSIISEQIQIFTSGALNPSDSMVKEFLSGLEHTVNDQINFAAGMQTVMSEQMRQFTENLQAAISNVAGQKSIDSD